MTLTTQTPRDINVLQDDGKEKASLLPAKGDLIQTVIQIVPGESVIPAMHSQSRTIERLHAKNEDAYVIVTAPIQQDQANVSGHFHEAHDDGTRYHVISEKELVRTGLRRAQVQKEANALRDPNEGQSLREAQKQRYDTLVA